MRRGIASKQKVRRDPYPALGRKDRVVVSWNQSLEPGLAGRVAGFGRGLVGSYGVGSVGGVRDMGLAQIRRGLGHRPYRLAHRTPVLYSRNQSRTNIALLKKRTRGEGSACRVAPVK